MFSVLPWFIRKEIILYTVSLEYSKYTLLNKEWFASSAGQFMKLEENMINFKLPSKWFKLAENLKTSNFFNLEWGFLSDCKKIKYMELFLEAEDKVLGDFNFEKLKVFIINSPLVSLTLRVDEAMKNWTFCLLKDISDKLYELELNLSESILTNVDFLELNFPKLTFFELNSFKGIIAFTTFQKCMPKIKYLRINLLNIDFKSIRMKKPTISYLEELEIDSTNNFEDEIEKSRFEEALNDVFKIRFPTLKSLDLCNVTERFKIKNVQLSMPNLKSLTLGIIDIDEVNIDFLTHLLPNLEDLNLHRFNNQTSVPVQINLEKVPRLLSFTAFDKFKLYNSNSYHVPLIMRIAFSDFTGFSYQSLFNLLPNLSELSVGCCEKLDVLKELIVNDKVIETLSLFNIEMPIKPDLLQPSFCNTTQLELTGTRFVSDHLIKWIQNQSQLTHLKLHYIANGRPKLTKSDFPNILNVNIYVY